MTRGQGDIVTFDILCGDFNFDNISPGISPSLCIILRSMHTLIILLQMTSHLLVLLLVNILGGMGHLNSCYDVFPIKINN